MADNVSFCKAFFFVFFSVFFSFSVFSENIPAVFDKKDARGNALEKGLIFYNCGAYDSSVFWLTAYLKEGYDSGSLPQYADAVIKLVYSHCLNGDFAKAEQAIRKAELLGKSNVLDEDLKNDIALARGYYHFLNSEFNEAIQYYSKVYDSDRSKYKKCPPKRS